MYISFGRETIERRRNVNLANKLNALQRKVANTDEGVFNMAAQIIHKLCINWSIRGKEMSVLVQCFAEVGANVYIILIGKLCERKDSALHLWRRE